MLLDNRILQRLCDNDASLTKLDLMDYSLGDEVAKAMSGMLARNTSLTSLRLWGNRIGDEGAIALAGMLAHNTSLTSLDLMDNSIGDEGAKAMAGMLAHNTSLTSLSLWNNSLADEGAKALTGMLEHNTSLIELYLWDNSLGNELQKQIDGLIKRNQQYFRDLQISVCKQLKIARVMLCKTESTNTGANLYLELPLEIKEKIVMHVNENALLTNEQQRLILNYASGKLFVPPIANELANKLSFFKVTKCDRVMKQLKGDEVEAAFQPSNSMG